MLANFDIDKNPRKNQTFSRTLVEPKRLGRTLPAIISGLSASQAQSQGLINDSAAETSSVSDAEPLFMEDPDEEQTTTKSRSGTPELKDDPNKLDPEASPFNPTSAPFQSSVPNMDPFASNSAFGKPSVFGAPPQAPDFSSTFKTTASETMKPKLFGTQQNPQFTFPPLPETTKQSTGSKSTSSTASASVAQQTSPFGQSPSLQAQAPAFSFRTSPLFGSRDNDKDPSNSSQDLLNATSKDLTPMPTDSIFSKPKAQEPPSTTPASSLFKFPTSSATLFSSPPTTSSSFPNITSTPLLSSPPNATPTSNEPPPKQSLSPFSNFLPPAGQPLFPTQINSSKSKNAPSGPPAPTASASETSTTTTTPSQSFIFPPPTAPGPQKATSQLAGPHSSTETSKPPRQPEIGAASSPSLPNVPRSPFTPTLPPAEQAKARPPRPDPRPAALDKLASAMVMDDEGLLSQFVEYTIGPIIAASFRQVKDEKSWAKASK